MPTDPSSRMLRLLSLLQTHRFWPGAELADRLEVSPRTLRRDIDRLRELGYLVDATRGAAGGYRLQAGTDLPPLLLDDDEAVAIAVGLRTAAGSAVDGIEETSVRALAKLEQVLPKRLRRRVQALGSSTVPLTYRREPVDAETLTTIAQACRDQERLQFDYTRRDGEGAGRAVEPHALVADDGALVPGGLGHPPRRLAHVPRRPRARAAHQRRAVPPAHAPRRAMRPRSCASRCARCRAATPRR